MSTRWRIGFDIGGTFTDFILLDQERNAIRLHKCLTTPQDPSVGALEGLDRRDRRGCALQLLRHDDESLRTEEVGACPWRRVEAAAAVKCNSSRPIQSSV